MHLSGFLDDIWVVPLCSVSNCLDSFHPSGGFLIGFHLCVSWL